MNLWPISIKVADEVHIHFADGRQKLPSSVRIVIDRLQTLLKAHSLSPAQLLRFIPPEWDWNLATLADAKELAAALGVKQLAWFAETFYVEPGWVYGSSETATRYLWGSKQPRQLFDRLTSEGWTNRDLRMVILAEDYGGGNGPLGRYAIAFSAVAAEFDNGESELRQYALFEPPWTWSHWPCRLDTKAVARWYAMSIGRFQQIPIVPISRSQFELMAARTSPLAEFVPDHSGGFDGFEDRVMRPKDWSDGESCCAIESAELPDVLEYLSQALASP